MLTAQAATTAGVTVDTIRHWCRYGAVAARKSGGRWSICPTSLARRVQIGQRRTASASAEVPATPAHMQRDTCMYQRYRGEWTVRLKGHVLKSAVQEAKAQGGPIVVLVTKRDGSLKRQALTGVYWKTMRAASPAESTFNAQIPAGDDRSGACAECHTWSRHLTPRSDSSGITLPVCGRCARLSWLERSYC